MILLFNRKLPQFSIWQDNSYLKSLFVYLLGEQLNCCAGPVAENTGPEEGHQEETGCCRVQQEAWAQAPRGHEDGQAGQQCGGALLPPPAGQRDGEDGHFLLQRGGQGNGDRGGGQFGWGRLHAEPVPGASHLGEAGVRGGLRFGVELCRGEHAGLEGSDGGCPHLHASAERRADGVGILCCFWWTCRHHSGTVLLQKPAGSRPGDRYRTISD